MNQESGVAIGAALALADAAGLATVVVAARDGSLTITHRSRAAAELFASLAPGIDLAAEIESAAAEGIVRLVAGLLAREIPSPTTIAPLKICGVDVVGATLTALPEANAVTVLLSAPGRLHPTEDMAVFAALCDMAPDFVSVAGFDHRIRYINEAGATMLGLASADDAVGLPFEDLVPAAERRGLTEIELPTVMRGDVFTGERHLRNQTTGAALAVQVTSFLVLDRQGRPEVVASIQRDISARRGVEQQLRDAEGRLRLIVGQVPAFFWTTDRDLRVTELFGRSAAASDLTPVGVTLREHWGPEDPSGAIACHERALAGESVRDESTKDGRSLRSYLEPLSDRTGAIIGVVGVALDVTEERSLEAQLRQSQKMEAVGQLAGGIAHDFNNMLLGIIGNVDLALLRLPDGADAARRSLLSARQAAERSAELTRRLLTFGRKDSVQPAAVDPRDVIRRAAELLRRTLGAAIHIDLRLDEPVRPIWIDPIQLEQIVMNLTINARDAMPDGGTLTLAATMDGEPGPPAVEITVSDTGVGISPEQQERIFEPFFTTKAEGTGLGLATVYAIATESGGHIELTSAPGEGTTIRLSFPVHDDPPATPQVAPVQSRHGN